MAGDFEVIEFGTCRSCAAPVFWARTPAGKRIPVNRDPVDAGNIIVEDGVAHVVSGERPRYPGGPARYTSHFATCPNAAAWRKG